MADLGLGLGALRLDDSAPTIPGPGPEDDLLVADATEDPILTSDGLELPDGSLVVNIGGPELLSSSDPTTDADDLPFTANLAEHLDDEVLGQISADLLDLIDQDERSRSEWLDVRANAIDQLGFSVESTTTGAATSSAPLEGMSRVKHPMLADAVLRFQATSRGELLPADGPVKVRQDDPFASTETDQRANNLQRAMNRYLTTTSPEYYPDTDRMFFWVGLGGCSFKKVYHCPLRRRPVSDTVDAEDLIVSNACTDLSNAPRITEKITMKSSTLRRMQIIGQYRDIDIGMPVEQETTPAQDARENVAGVRLTGMRSDTVPYSLYECYCELDIPGHEHMIDGKPSGLAVPYRVVIDRSSQKILEIRRNWREGDSLCLPREVYVKYSFVPAMGFYDIGLGHIMGNVTNAATAGWREGLDAGMFANFPGFLYAKGFGRQNSLDMRVAPGAGVQVDTGGAKIQDAIMPLPYKEMGPGMMALINNIIEEGKAIGGAPNQAVSEGSQQAPVGTTLALIEQAMVMMSAVHKRLHTAQSREFQLLVELFREDPQAFFRNNPGAPKDWQVADLLSALSDYDIVPTADPNTAGAIQRVSKAQAVYMIAKDNPPAFDQLAVYTYVLMALGVGQPTSLLAKGPPDNKPDPNDAMGAASLLAANARMLDAQTKEKRLALDAAKAQMENENKDKDRDLAQMLVILKAAIEQAQSETQTSADHTAHTFTTLADLIENAEQRDHEKALAATPPPVDPNRPPSGPGDQ